MANDNRLRNQFILMVFVQVFVTSFFVLQWIIAYLCFLLTQYGERSAEEWAIAYFALGLTNNFYYIINVKSFYLSTLTSNLFRKTLIAAFWKLLPGVRRPRGDASMPVITTTLGTKTRREEVPPNEA